MEEYKDKSHYIALYYEVDNSRLVDILGLNKLTWVQQLINLEGKVKAL